MNLCMKLDERITYHVNVSQWKALQSRFNCIFFGTLSRRITKANFHTALNWLSDSDSLENQVAVEAFKSTIVKKSWHWKTNRKALGYNFAQLKQDLFARQKMHFCKCTRVKWVFFKRMRSFADMTQQSRQRIFFVVVNVAGFSVMMHSFRQYLLNCKAMRWNSFDYRVISNGCVWTRKCWKRKKSVAFNRCEEIRMNKFLKLASFTKLKTFHLRNKLQHRVGQNCLTLRRLNSAFDSNAILWTYPR